MNWFKKIIAQATLEKQYYAVKVFQETPNNPRGKYVLEKIFHELEEARQYARNISKRRSFPLVDPKIVRVPEQVAKDYVFLGNQIW